MIDFHSHILPGIDDGSKNVEESVELLDMLFKQGIRTVLATPHFYANNVSVEKFLERRSRALEKLKPALTDNHPKVICGAEIAYYPGISRLEGLDRLRIEGTNLLLIEMPMSKWPEYAVRELTEIAARGNTRVIVAHMERYMDMQKDDVIERVYESGIFVQCNASFFLEFGTKRKALHMLGNGSIHMLGSDCHGLKTRPPRIGKAMEVITKKFGEDFAEDFKGFGYAVLKDEI